MPRSRRRFIHNQALFITSRVGTGLPFICDPLIERIPKGVIAEAQHLSPVEINALLFMGNHYQMVAICNPDTLDSFMEHLNGEVSQAIALPFSRSHAGTITSNQQRRLRLVVSGEQGGT